MNPEWTYEGYWNAVLGGNRTARDVRDEFNLSKKTVSEWLREAEVTAAREGGIAIPEEWQDFREQALAELERACNAETA